MSTLVYLVHKQWKNSKIISISINIQLILMIMQAGLFLIKDSWQAATDKYDIDKKEYPSFIYGCYVVGFTCFQSLHWMYVSQYTSVAIMIPLAFSAQIPKIVRKRTIYPKVIFAIDLTVYIILITTLVVECINKKKNIVEKKFS